MTSIAIKLLEDALGLSESDRADLAARLIVSLDPKFEKDASIRLTDSIARRLFDLDTGTLSTIPWPEARHLILAQPDGAESIRNQRLNRMRWQ